MPSEQPHQPSGDAHRTRRLARLLVWTGAAVVLGAVVGLVYAIHPLVT